MTEGARTMGADPMSEADISALIRAEIAERMKRGDGLQGIVAIAVDAYFSARRTELRLAAGTHLAQQNQHVRHGNGVATGTPDAGRELA